MRHSQPTLTASRPPSLRANLYIHTLGLLSHFIPAPPMATKEDSERHAKEDKTTC